MQHKISELCNVIDVMYSKSTLLYREKYEKPEESRSEIVIKSLIDDIQALALQVAHDRAEHPKKKS